MDQRVVLYAIADLTESLIVDANEARGSYCCDWAKMVGEVNGEMLRWAKSISEE